MTLGLKKYFIGGGAFDAALIILTLLFSSLSRTELIIRFGVTLTNFLLVAGWVAPVIRGLRVPVHTIGYGTQLAEMQEMSSLNEASSTPATPEDVVYNLKNIFNAQM